MKDFGDLSEREVLAVAISSEEEDSRIYMSFAEDLQDRYPDTAKIFEEMAEEERGHRHRLLELYEQRFGPHLPPIRREEDGQRFGVMRHQRGDGCILDPKEFGFVRGFIRAGFADGEQEGQGSEQVRHRFHGREREPLAARAQFFSTSKALRPGARAATQSLHIPLPRK